MRAVTVGGDCRAPEFSGYDVLGDFSCRCQSESGRETSSGGCRTKLVTFLVCTVFRGGSASWHPLPMLLVLKCYLAP